MSSGKEEVRFTEGDRVQILKSYKGGEYKATVGLCGTVVGISCSNIAIKVDDKVNVASSIGAFWYKSEELKVVESEEEMVLEKGYMVASVVFEDGCNPKKKYSYALYDPMGYDAIGKLAITDMNKVCRIVNVVMLENIEHYGYTEPTKPLKGVCDDTLYKTILENAAKKKELKASMDARVKLLEKDAVYEMFAQRDPELAELLKAYKEL